MTLLLLMVSMIILVTGAEFLVRGASRLANAFGVSPLLIGLTIVAFGTSAPELAVSIKAVFTGHADLVVGTNIGSSIFNILFVLGLCALVAPLIVIQQLVWIDVPVMIGSHILLYIMCFNGKIERWNAAILFTGLVVYILYALNKGQKESRAVKEEYERAFSAKKPKPTTRTLLTQLGLIIFGLFCCVIGAGWLVDSAVVLAQDFGVSELVIGITIVAAGTSLPEAATSIVATYRGQRDIAIGNVVGSCIFNALGIIGATGLVAPEGIAVAPAAISLDLPVAIAATVACLPIFFTGHRISRWEGGVFFGYYLIYTSYLLMAANQHDSLPLFNTILVWFVLPLTLITLAVLSYRFSKAQ